MASERTVRPVAGAPDISGPITDPQAIQAELDRLCRGLDAAGRELGQRIEECSYLELAYGDLFDDALVQLVEDAAGARLPGEDVRRALIHRDPEIREAYHKMRRVSRRIDALERWSRKVEAELMARASQLKSLLAER